MEFTPVSFRARMSRERQGNKSRSAITALATAFGMRQALPERKWVYRTLFVMSGLIAVATVYGRYHYLADATYGAVIATLRRTGARAQTK